MKSVGEKNNKQQLLQTPTGKQAQAAHNTLVNIALGVVVVPGVVIFSIYGFRIIDQITRGSSFIKLPNSLKFIPVIMGFIIVATILFRMRTIPMWNESIWHASKHHNHSWIALIYVGGIFAAYVYKKTHMDNEL